ncbi:MULTISPECIES: hypothetical protein [unclassified Novosphingobium]|uniref:hypothetical protein n=1 Tax=unclassified Novosphingobium TaxID=2644732 RepID=UPI00135CDA70|nr:MULTISPECIES: hypothetical protein [unclassified Novosphingobium]
MRPIPRLATAFAALVLIAPAATFAQEQHTATDIPESANPEARRQTLNAEQAAAARAQVKANAASEAHHDTAVALNHMQTQRNDALYADALARHDAAEQDYSQNRKQWERTNPYCWKGDAVKCPADPEAPVPGG